MKPGQRLGDEAVNAFLLSVLAKHTDAKDCFIASSYFYAKLINQNTDFPNGKGYVYKDVERWTNNIDIFDKRLVVIPLNLDPGTSTAHWTLMVARIKGQGSPSIEYIDSFFGNGAKHIAIMRKWLTDERVKARKKSHPMEEEVALEEYRMESQAYISSWPAGSFTQSSGVRSMPRMR